MLPHSHPRTQRYNMRSPPPMSMLYRYRYYWLVFLGAVIVLFLILMLYAVAHVTRRPW